MLLEFFMHCGKNIDDLSLILSQILTPKMLNLKANDFIEHERVYFIFMQDLIEKNPLKIDIPRNSVVNAIDLKFIDHQILDLFENKNIFDML